MSRRNTKTSTRNRDTATLGAVDANAKNPHTIKKS